MKNKTVAFDGAPDTDYPVVEGAGGLELYANVDGRGGTILGKPVWSLDQVVANLNRTSYPGTDIGGPGWDQGEYGAPTASEQPGVIRFGFQTTATIAAAPYVYEENGQLLARTQYFGFQEFSDAQKAAAREAITLWDDLVAFRFEETTADQADITYGNYTNQPGTQAYAYLPYDYGGSSAGLQRDVWVNGLQASNLQLDYGFYGKQTLVHETGHAIGLQHPNAYNAAPGLSITYPANAEYYQDTRQYSVMSYFNAEFSGGGHIDWNRLNWVYSATPLVHDIAAAQAIYGTDTATRTGDTVYGFNSTAGRDVFDFAKNEMPVLAIWNAGGNDTLDFSGWDTPSTINLNPGQFSSGGGSGVVPLDVLKARGLLPATYTEEQYLALRTRYNAVDGLLHDNIAIAYGATIENAIGGGGNDLIIANSVANVLNGGAGTDTVSYRDAASGVSIQLGFMRGSGGDAAGDRYIDVERFEGSNFADSLNGSSSADTMYGLGGADTLNGANGDDLLDGGEGDDRLDGGNGNDQLFGGAGKDVLNAGNSDDQLSGGAGDDQLDGGNGKDQLSGGDGNDVLDGNDGNDRLFGDAGNDVLRGGSGDDLLNGGVGADVLTGGAGRDVFVFADRGDTDVITDFRRGQDLIDLTGFDANATTTGKDAFTWIGGGSFTGNAGELHVYSSGGSYFLSGDLDGDKIADFVINVGSQPLTQADIIFA